jgi:hypothetical protein
MVDATYLYMQASGRPFGNVELALLASERGCEATRLVDPDGWLHWGQVGRGVREWGQGSWPARR